MTLDAFQQSSNARNERAAREFAQQLSGHYAEAGRQIKRQLDSLYTRVLAGIEPEEYYAVAVKYDRLAKLQAQVADALKAASDAARETVSEASRLAMESAYYSNQYALSAASGATGVTIGFNRLPTELVELAVAGTPKAWREITANMARFGALEEYRPARGTLSQLLLDRQAADLKRVQGVVVQAIIQGQNPRRAGALLTQAITTTRNFAERILRTEMHRTQSLGHYAASENAKANGARIRRQIVSVLDDRTRPQSAQVDGQMEDADGFFTYPGGVKVRVPGATGVPEWDINDRETVIDIVEGLEPEARIARVPGDPPPRDVRERLQRAGLPVPGENYTIGWANFAQWAGSVGLKTNRYGQAYS